MSESDDIEVIEVVLSTGSGLIVRSLSLDAEIEAPILALDDKWLLFPTVADLAAFGRDSHAHTLVGHPSWADVVEAATRRELVAELLDSYDLTEVADLVTGDAEDRWTAGLLLTLALEISDTADCPTLSGMPIDAPLIALEGDSSTFEGPKNSMRRRALSDEADKKWPAILAELEAKAAWWSGGGYVAPRPPERSAADAARQLAQAEASVASLDPDPIAVAAKRVPLDVKGADFVRTTDPKRPAPKKIETRPAPKAAPVKAAVPAPAPKKTAPAPALDDDDGEPGPLWDGVDAYPIEIHLPRGVGYTVVGYPDETSTVFLGRPGQVLVFANRRTLVTYLRENPDHSLAALPGWGDMGPLDAAALTPAGFYYLHDVADRLDDEDLDEDGCSEIADALEIAVELAQQLNISAVLDELDGTGPLNLYVAALLDPDAMDDFPAVEDAAAQWNRVVALVDNAVTWKD